MKIPTLVLAIILATGIAGEYVDMEKLLRHLRLLTDNVLMTYANGITTATEDMAIYSKQTELLDVLETLTFALKKSDLRKTDWEGKEEVVRNYGRANVGKQDFTSQGIGGPLPELDRLVEGAYQINTGCLVNLDLSGCRLEITTDPESCADVRLFLSTVLPNLSLEDYNNGVASDLLDVALHSGYIDRCRKVLSVSGGATEPITVKPSVLTIKEFSVYANYSYGVTPSFNALFSGVWNIGEVEFAVTLAKSNDGFTLSGKAAEISVSTNKIISGLSSFVPGNDIDGLFNLLNLGSISVTNINVEVMIADGGLSLELDFRKNSFNSRVFFFLNLAELGDGSTFPSLSMGMSVKSVRFGDLIRDVIDENVVVPIISDLIIPEAAFLATTTTPDHDYPEHLMNKVALELSKGLGLAFTLKLSDGVPFGTFFLGFNGSRYMFKVLSEETVPVSALLSKAITSFTSINLPPQLPVADVLAGSLKSFEYDTSTEEMTVFANVENSLVIIENILVLEDLTAIFQLQKKSPSSGNDFHLNFKIDSMWKIGQLSVALSVDRSTQGFFALGSVEGELPVGAMIQEFGVSFIPTGILRDKLLGFGIGEFSIVDPSVSVIFGQEFAVHVSGSAVIGDWSSNVEMIVGRMQKKLVMAAGVTLSNICIVPVVSKLTGGALDISVIPGASILSHTSVAFAVSSSTMPRDQHLMMSSSLLADVKINQGVSLAASFSLPTDCGQDVFCKVVKRLLGPDIKLKLLATLTTVSDLYMKAVVGTPVTLADGIELQEVGVEIKVGTKDNFIGLTGSLKLENPPLTLRGGVGVSQSGVYLRMSSEGTWSKAFGLDFLAISDINFGVSITPEPTVISSFKLGGHAIIGDQNNPGATPIKGSVYVSVNKIDPRQNYCSGSISALTIPDILLAFGQTSFQLPPFLNEIGFPNEVRFSYSLLPQNDVAIPAGFILRGTLKILRFRYGADLKLDSTSLYAEMTVDSFGIGKEGLIHISGSSSKTGPVLKVDISWVPIRAKLLIDGTITAFDIQSSATISMDESKTYFSIEGKFLNKFQTSLAIEASYGDLEKAEFLVTGKFKNDLMSTLRDRVKGFLDNLMKEANQALGTARSDVRKAQQKCNDARGPFESAQEKVKGLQQHFDYAVADLQRAKQDLENKKRKFYDAVADLNEKQKRCKLRECAWWDALCHAHNAGLAVCLAALETAKVAVKATKHTLDVAKLAIRAAREVVDNSRWTLDAAKAVLKGTEVTVHQACTLGLRAADEALGIVEKTHKFGIKLTEKVTGVVGRVLDIKEMGFSASVAVAQKGSFVGWMKASFFGNDPVMMDIKIEIYSIEDMVKNICNEIKGILGV